MADAIRLFFFAGKGGVGKTTLSSSFALGLAERGIKTLLISTDPAHSLSDILGTQVGASPVEVTRNLSAVEIDPQEAVDSYIKRTLRVVERTFSPESIQHIRDMVKGIKDAPGTLETALIDALSELILSNLAGAKAIVVDTAPTGHTLYMISTVRKAGKWLEELIEKKERAHKLREMAGGEAEGTEIIESLRERRQRLVRFSDLLSSSQTSFLPVMIAQKLSIEETRRLVESLRAWDLKVSKIIVNRVLPESNEGFMKKRKEQEQAYINEIIEIFGKERILFVPLQERDPVGIENLRHIGRYLEEILP